MKQEAQCIRQIENWSVYQPHHKLDNPSFDKTKVKKELGMVSPKMEELLRHIEELDDADMKRDKKHYKHMIFSDLKAAGGAKAIGAALLAHGFTLVYNKSLELIQKLPAKTDKTFAILCTTKIYNKDIGVRFRRRVLEKFNERPDNIHGENLRFIVLDYGFKEGIDLFDIKYVHIMETPITPADQKQIVGRGTRFCGQKGLRFDKEHGWPLYVYTYKSIFPEDLEHKALEGSETMFDLFMKYSNIDASKLEFSKDLEKRCIQASVDFSLNRNIHSYGQDKDSEFMKLTKEIEKDYPQAIAAIKKKKEFVETLGVKLEKHGFFYCKSGCKGNVMIIPTTVMLLAWYIIPKKLDYTHYILERRPRSILCEQMKKNEAYCTKLREVWNNLEQYLYNHHVEIEKRIQELPDTKKSLVEQKKDILKFIKDTLDTIELDPEPPKKELDYLEMQGYVQTRFKKFTWPEITMENMCEAKKEYDKEKEAEEKGEVVKDSTLQQLMFTPSQQFLQTYFQPSSAYKGLLVWHSVGTGKCHAKDTPILMYDGTIKKVQYVEVGDLLMGDDSTPRKVLSLAQGTDDMFDIVPNKGEKYTVNSEHILVLKYNSIGVTYNKRQPNTPYRADVFDNRKIAKVSKSFKTREEAEAFLKYYENNEKRTVEIEVKDFLKLAPSMQKELKGMRVGVEFKEKTVPLDPYFIGIWLGDGCSRTSKFTTADKEILDYMTNEVGKYGLRIEHEKNYDYRISGNGKVGNNFIVNTLRKYNLLNNKHIPHDYLVNSRVNRLRLLAGIIDTDGHYDKKGNGYDIIQKSNVISEGILFLARSLGFAAYSKKCTKSCIYKGVKKEGTYNRIFISGNVNEIPVLIPHKKSKARGQQKDVLITGIKVNPTGQGKYYGFTLDGNNRYLLGDFTITHNTCSGISVATNSFEKEGYTILWVTRSTLKGDIWKNMFQQICSISLRQQEEKGEILNKEEAMKKPLKHVAKNWVEPITFKQFSNLLSGKNEFYKEMVKRNGSTDPLRKTLVIIDEAHKLLSHDLKPQEKPDFEVLKKKIHESYETSKKDSVRLLLMTATPYSEDPMQMIELLNLMRPKSDQFPSDYSDFKKKYLTEKGIIKQPNDFLGKVSGYISYLNRETDIRQFAHPVLKTIPVPISESTGKEIKEKLVKLEEELDHAEETFAKNEELKKKGKERMKGEKKELTDKCKEIKNREQKKKCKEDLAKRSQEFKEYLFTDTDKILKNAKEKMKGLKKDIQKTRNELKNYRETDPSQERMLLEKCFKQESDK